MSTETSSTDAEGRIRLPEAFANSTVVIDLVNENELRIRKAHAPRDDENCFTEETPIVLSERDRLRFLGALDQGPTPNGALRRLMAGEVKPNG